MAKIKITLTAETSEMHEAVAGFLAAVDGKPEKVGIARRAMNLLTSGRAFSTCTGKMIDGKLTIIIKPSNEFKALMAEAA